MRNLVSRASQSVTVQFLSVKFFQFLSCKLKFVFLALIQLVSSAVRGVPSVTQCEWGFISERGFVKNPVFGNAKRVNVLRIRPSNQMDMAWERRIEWCR